MLDMLRKLLPTQYQDENEKRSMVNLLRSLTIIQILASVGIMLLAASGGWSYLYLPVAIMFSLQIISFFLLRRGNLLPAQLLLPLTLYVLLIYVLVTQYGLHDINVIGFAVVINLASLTLGLGWMFFFSFLVVLAVFAVGLGEMLGVLQSPTSALSSIVSPISISLVVLVIAFVQRTLINRMNENLRRARENEKQQMKSNEELRELKATLESRVEERTAELGERSRELEAVSRHMAKRADELQAVAQVGRAITSIYDLEKLLPHVTRVISEQFGFYHAGIFLIDPSKEYALLRAASSEGGQIMLARGHKLKIGETGIVGYVAAFGRPRIALDIGADAAYFSNPDLPDTHSEMALPLKIGEKIIGVLDVQSEQTSAFSDEDIELLTIVADQVTIAIQNALRFAETQQAMAEAEAISHQYLRQEWQAIVEEQAVPAYRYSSARVETLDQPVLTPEVQLAVQNGQNSTSQEGSQRRMAIPIKLRDQVIGILDLQTGRGKNWQQDEIDIAQAIADRVAIAIENVRLLESSQALASRERAIGEITSRIGASINLRSVLQTAVEELGRVMPGSDVIIQLESGKSKE